jgi:hypothetical protein
MNSREGCGSFLTASTFEESLAEKMIKALGLIAELPR